jgi:hypothetical protein
MMSMNNILCLLFFPHPKVREDEQIYKNVLTCTPKNYCRACTYLFQHKQDTRQHHLQHGSSNVGFCHLQRPAERNISRLLKDQEPKEEQISCED